MNDPLLFISARALALTGALLFIPVIASFAVSPGAIWAEYIGIFFHLTMFLLVAKLDAPEWAKAAGYGWLVLDVMTGVCMINGVPNELADYFRLGGHVFGGVWIVGASCQGSIAVRIVGSLAGTWLGGYSLVSAMLPTTFLAPASLLVTIWLLLIGFQDGTRAMNRSGVRGGWFV